MCFAGEVVFLGLDVVVAVSEDALEGGDEDFVVDEALLGFFWESGGGAEEALDEGDVGEGGALGDDEVGDVGWEEVAVAAAAVVTWVVVLVFWVEEEVVVEVLSGEEVEAVFVGHVEAWEGAALVCGCGHGAVAEDGLFADGVCGADVAFLCPVFFGVLDGGDLGVGFGIEEGVCAVAVFVVDGVEACGFAVGEPLVEFFADVVVACGDLGLDWQAGEEECEEQGGGAHGGMLDLV